MNQNNMLGLLLSYVLIFLVIGVSTVLQKIGWVKDEGARKFIHIGVSNWWILAMIFFDDIIFASIAPITFIILNYLSYRLNIIKAMERGGKGNLGTVYFPISLLILVIFTFAIKQPFIGAMGILVMGYGDGLAAVVGSKYGKRKLPNNKSLEGSLTMFFASFIVLFIIGLVYYPQYALLIAFVIALLASIVELFTPKGLDNLTVPLSTSLCAYVLLLMLSMI